ncbi:MAG: coiled-coil domain-containing protein [Candidatus Thorarchaeota archaeon]
MFYNNGIVFQTTFEHDINVPKLGENLAEFLNHIKNVYEICNFKLEDYKKLIFETDEMSVIILKLGEDSNIALFFKKEEEGDLKLSSIKRYITRIEELIDMNEKEIIIQEILVKEEEQKHLQILLNDKENSMQDLQEKLGLIDKNEQQEEFKTIEKDLTLTEEECVKIKKEITQNEEEIRQLKDFIEKDKKV